MKNWFIVNDNCKLSGVLSGIAPAKQESRQKNETRWIPIKKNYSSINTAQLSIRNVLHIPLNGDVYIENN